MDENLLQDLGLTQAESRIYLVLLKDGASLAGMISRNTGIHRRSVYDAVERLIQKGLVSYIKKNNRKYFEAASPDRFLDILHKKEADFQTALPQLKMLQNMSGEKNETLFFRGKAGLKTAFDDQISVGEDILIFGASSKANDYLPFYFPHYDKSRQKKKIHARLIFNEVERDSKFVKKIPLSEIRFVSKDTVSDSAFMIYGRNVCIVAWRPDPVAILIREDIIADGLRNYFELLWKVAKV
jgi:sugar-specific transcriptional regulator TrmB